MKPDVDHVIGDDSQPDPTFDAWNPLEPGPIQPMAAFENGDAAFGASAPLLSLLEPALLLFLLAFFTFGGATGNGHSLHAQLFRCGFIGGGEESRVGGGENWNSTQQLLVLFDRRRQQIGITGALIQYFAVDDDLILRFLDLDHLSEIRWLTCLASPHES